MTPVSAMLPTVRAQVRNAAQAARKSFFMLAELDPDSTQDGTTPATHTPAAMKTVGCMGGRTLEIQPSAGTPSTIHQMPAEWTRNRIKDMEQSI